MSPIENILLSRGIENPQEYLNANEDNLYSQHMVGVIYHIYYKESLLFTY